MLELIDLDREISKEQYDQVFPAMEAQLGQCQREARASGVPMVVVFEGWDAAGKGTLINRLALALDPRGFKVCTNGTSDEGERLRPWLWRYWNELPAAGAMVIFDRSWYRRLLENRVEGEAPGRDRPEYEDIQEFERQLTDSGVVLVKFWLHISRKEQKRRLRALAKDPDTAWRVGKRERRQHRHYDEWLLAVEEMLHRTSTPYAPWTVVEATQDRFARVKVFETVLTALRQELDRRANEPPPKKRPMPLPDDSPTRRQTVLDRVDLTLSLPRPTYDQELGKLQERLFELEHRLYTARVPAVIVYEGWDASGKGGNIRRLAAGLDPRGYEVISIAAPTAEELAHHYLWRFWRRVPKAGHIAIFDRSWYGRVLVERVEGFCTDDEWRRAYREINEFERQLTQFGTVMVKLWLHIDQDEQLRRFEARKQEKRWKIGEEDWRNREKWRQYEIAVTEMLERTSTTYAPWTIVEANDKLYGRIKSLRTVADAIEAGLKT
ncbi:MAG: polyphosphate:AMP phosphotransferase [Thermoguttaceae bacterium]|jgi:polyphosphate:AMP phosphotransferase|nr:polyphosphate:AMP phosphotransferase [Thermoguttaceae bacterium]